MTKTKSNRIFLGIVTCAMALAGTGLTIANNWENDLQIAAIAITLAACFTAAETTFLWGHKRFETSTRLWRKIALAVSLGLIVVAMGYAVSEELKLALNKVSNRSMAGNSAIVVGSAHKSNQSNIARSALKILGEGNIKPNHIPFVICYVITGLVSIVILAVTERARERVKGSGNLLPTRPDLADRVKEQGINLDDAKVYAVRGGYAIHTKAGYQAHLKETEKDKKKSIGF